MDMLVVVPVKPPVLLAGGTEGVAPAGWEGRMVRVVGAVGATGAGVAEETGLGAGAAPAVWAGGGVAGVVGAEAIGGGLLLTYRPAAPKPGGKTKEAGVAGRSQPHSACEARRIARLQRPIWRESGPRCRRSRMGEQWMTFHWKDSPQFFQLHSRSKCHSRAASIGGRPRPVLGKPGKSFAFQWF